MKRELITRIRVGRSVALAAVLLTVAPVSAQPNRPVVVFTIDVESNAVFRLPDQIDAVCDRTACGLTEIVKMLDDHRWAGTFFLNVYEKSRWGEGAMRKLALRLQDAGQDIGLHTHPQDAYDFSRQGMREYSLEEQTTIVRDGVQLLERWTGLPVVSHRTGAYAADERTLRALERNGVLVDSSLFWRNPDSRLDGLGLPRNLPGRHGRLVQIPVTVYEREDRPDLFSSRFAPVRVVRKIDPDWFINEAEMRSAIDAAVDAQFPVIVVFLHSFSFMKPGADGQPVANRHSIDLFRAILDHVEARNLPVATMRELAAREFPSPSVEKDVVPRVAVSMDLTRYVWSRIKAADRVTLGTHAVMVLAGIGLLFATARRFVPSAGKPGSRSLAGGLSR